MPLATLTPCKNVLVCLPPEALKRGTENFLSVYHMNLREDIKDKCGQQSTFFSFSNYRMMTMESLLDMPIERYDKGLYDAMNGCGTDEFTLTGLVCTLPPNLYGDIHPLYEQKHERTLVDHIESETSFCYKKVLVNQALSWPQSRALAQAKMASASSLGAQITPQRSARWAQAKS